MKNHYILSIICVLFISCANQVKREERNISLGDTVTTASGLKYIFLKEGKGNSIEIGSRVKVYTDLYIDNPDSIFWSTSEEEDSIFSFIHGKTSLIKGFTEVHNYLVEGDEIIAIIPDSLAYGKEGSNGMPPRATLIYNPLVIKHVSEPKKLINDTLQSIASKSKAKAAIDFYEQIINSEQKSEYHTDMELILGLLDSLTEKKLYKETQELSAYFGRITKDNYYLESIEFYQMVAFEEQGMLDEAITITEKQGQKKGSNVEWWEEKKKDLERKQDSLSK